jgi:hypothetical protein
VRGIPRKIIVPFDELNHRDGEGQYFKVWDDNDPFVTHPTEDIEYVPATLLTALEEKHQAALGEARAASAFTNEEIDTMLMYIALGETVALPTEELKKMRLEMQPTILSLIDRLNAIRPAARTPTT